jgi:hypothetical protein
MDTNTISKGCGISDFSSVGFSGGDFTSLGFTGGGFNGIPGVPEPTTWAMMLLGFAGIGFAGFRRTKRSA